MATTTTKLSPAQEIALDFIKSPHSNWGSYASEKGYGYAGDNPAAWKIRCPTFATYESLARKGLVKVGASGRYEAVS